MKDTMSTEDDDLFEFEHNKCMLNLLARLSDLKKGQEAARYLREIERRFSGPRPQTICCAAELSLRRSRRRRKQMRQNCFENWINDTNPLENASSCVGLADIANCSDSLSAVKSSDEQCEDRLKTNDRINGKPHLRMRLSMCFRSIPDRLEDADLQSLGNGQFDESICSDDDEKDLFEEFRRLAHSRNASHNSNSSGNNDLTVTQFGSSNAANHCYHRPRMRERGQSYTAAAYTNPSVNICGSFVFNVDLSTQLQKLTGGELTTGEKCLPETTETMSISCSSFENIPSLSNNVIANTKKTNILEQQGMPVLKQAECPKNKCPEREEFKDFETSQNDKIPADVNDTVCRQSNSGKFFSSNVERDRKSPGLPNWQSDCLVRRYHYSDNSTEHIESHDTRERSAANKSEASTSVINSRSSVQATRECLSSTVDIASNNAQSNVFKECGRSTDFRNKKSNATLINEFCKFNKLNNTSMQSTTIDRELYTPLQSSFCGHLDGSSNLLYIDDISCSALTDGNVRLTSHSIGTTDSLDSSNRKSDIDVNLNKRWEFTDKRTSPKVLTAASPVDESGLTSCGSVGKYVYPAVPNSSRSTCADDQHDAGGICRVADKLMTNKFPRPLFNRQHEYDSSTLTNNRGLSPSEFTTSHNTITRTSLKNDNCRLHYSSSFVRISKPGLACEQGEDFTPHTAWHTCPFVNPGTIERQTNKGPSRHKEAHQGTQVVQSPCRLALEKQRNRELQNKMVGTTEHRYSKRNACRESPIGVIDQTVLMDIRNSWPDDNISNDIVDSENMLGTYGGSDFTLLSQHGCGASNARYPKSKQVNPASQLLKLNAARLEHCRRISIFANQIKQLDEAERSMKRTSYGEHSDARSNENEMISENAVFIRNWIKWHQQWSLADRIEKTRALVKALENEIQDLSSKIDGVSFSEATQGALSLKFELLRDARRKFEQLEVNLMDLESTADRNLSPRFNDAINSQQSGSSYRLQGSDFRGKHSGDQVERGRTYGTQKILPKYDDTSCTCGKKQSKNLDSNTFLVNGLKNGSVTSAGKGYFKNYLCTKLVEEQKQVAALEEAMRILQIKISNGGRGVDEPSTLQVRGGALTACMPPVATVVHPAGSSGNTRLETAMSTSGNCVDGRANGCSTEGLNMDISSPTQTLSENDGYGKHNTAYGEHCLASLKDDVLLDLADRLTPSSFQTASCSLPCSATSPVEFAHQSLVKKHSNLSFSGRGLMAKSIDEPVPLQRQQSYVRQPAASSNAESRQGTNSACNFSVQRRQSNGVSTKQERPLTRYLALPGPDLDLRKHIENAGHIVDQNWKYISLTKTTCCGYLIKRGQRFRTWHKRWFVFDRVQRLFSYYNSQSNEQSGHCRGQSTFQSICEVYVDHLNFVKSPAPRSTFVVKTLLRTFYLVAPTAELMRIWIDVLITGAEGHSEYLQQ